ncbi:uncharacterized protein LOC121367864 isoform X2 [Gigantopelta aegis]|uniref:uncharacterized protein LOC121367864 isoform X2 n=1 Tax=Gigantopelta aegis TaxID=1735272 RepID=UPI001B88CC8E|nr:uncharacterized protein LOC121367864 isoform X2 [Gigantopelta aegis]XP_041348246.1 uncharacterized protein LOC121367864 isoform X2 [Gigantopelta aegis]XP_041348255.1 uncharacterized protein LOC121367864 isoform X2 [Gigantopelta aegis]
MQVGCIPYDVITHSTAGCGGKSVQITSGGEARPTFPQICRSTFDCVGLHQVCVLTISRLYGHCFIRAVTGHREQVNPDMDVDERLIEDLDKIAVSAATGKRRKRGISGPETHVVDSGAQSHWRSLNSRKKRRVRR